MRELTLAEKYRLIKFGDWDLEDPNVKWILGVIQTMSEENPEFAAEINQIDAEFAAQKRDNWVENILAE
jgi:MinD superfamily P-loop ATPase